MLGASCRGGKKENNKNPSSSLLGENHASQKTFLTISCFLPSLSGCFFLFFWFSSFHLAVMLKKHQKPLVVPPRRKPCFAKTFLVFSCFLPSLSGCFFLFFWFSSFISHLFQPAPHLQDTLLLPSSELGMTKRGGYAK